jgi:chromosome partitioning protein
MPTILVANPKGGSGKTTLATNVAGWLAGKRQQVAMADADPQRSATQWLERRPTLFPAVEAADVERRHRKVADAWLVVDSPAGLHGEGLRDAMRRADVLLVPVSPSLDDFVKSQGVARVTNLRDTQVYVHCAREGLSVFDLPRSRAEQDWEQWRPLTRWIARHAPVRH